MSFNENPFAKTDTQKYLGMFLDTKRVFDYLNTVFEKTNKTIGLFVNCD